MADPNLGDHQFGGVSTDLKLSIVEGYLKAFTTALRPRFRELVYIDAFAGTGERTVAHAAVEANLWDDYTPARIERLRGSAKIAIDIVPPFDQLLFTTTGQRRGASAFANSVLAVRTDMIDAPVGRASSLYNRSSRLKPPRRHLRHA